MASSSQKAVSGKSASVEKRSKSPVKKSGKKAGKKPSIESRLEYYNEKYGDSFTVTSSVKGVGDAKTKKTEGKVKQVFKKIFGKK